MTKLNALYNGLLFISAQELNEESGELFGGTLQALAREERAKHWVLADARKTVRTTSCNPLQHQVLPAMH